MTSPPPGPPPSSRLALAKAKAEAARARFSNTIGQLQERARPTSLVHDITDTLKERSADVVAGLVDTAKTKPARTGAALALIGLFFARRQISDVVRRAVAHSMPSPTPAKKGPTR